MFPTFVEFYDLIYLPMKDYAAEAAAVAALLRRHHPGCHRVLDVECGTGHLAADGAVLVEPWFPPGILNEDLLVRNDGAGDGVRVSRESRVTVDGSISRLHFTYDITDECGPRQASEVDELGLFTTSEMLEAFWSAGFEAQYDPEGPGGRGLSTAAIAGGYAADGRGCRRGSLLSAHRLETAP